MKYMGSKSRLAKEILPIILKDRQPNQWYVEPFVGGCNIIDKVDGNRIGNDINKYVIAAFKQMQNDVDFIDNLPFISEILYKEIQHNKDNYPDWLVGYVAFNFSWGSKYFGGYARSIAGDKSYTNEVNQNRLSRNNMLKQLNSIQDIVFLHLSYKDLIIPHGSIIYCDAPYQNTTAYKDSINYTDYWQWCRDKTIEGNKVFISEYNAPDDFTCIWSKVVKTTLGKDSNNIDRTEKLFIYQPIKN